MKYSSLIHMFTEIFSKTFDDYISICNTIALLLKVSLILSHWRCRSCSTLGRKRCRRSSRFASVGLNWKKWNCFRFREGTGSVPKRNQERKNRACRKAIQIMTRFEPTVILNNVPRRMWKKLLWRNFSQKNVRYLPCDIQYDFITNIIFALLLWCPEVAFKNNRQIA